MAIFIEVFSFFFLKLYKSGLADILYYQNELTNLESKFLALELASLGRNTEARGHMETVAHVPVDLDI